MNNKREIRKLKREQSTNLVITDFLFGVMALIVALFVMVAMKNEDTESPGSIEVLTFWPESENKDVDTWGKIEGRPWVGYNSTGTGDGFSLVYDDKGWDGHKIKRNFENMYARELLAGKYTINVHFFSDKSRPKSGSVDVNVIVKIMEKGSTTFKVLVDRDITLEKVKDEITVCTFEIGDDGKVVKGSLEKNPKLIPRTTQRRR